MVRWLYTFFICLAFPYVLPAQCEFLPGLQKDSSWVVWANSGLKPNNSIWFESPTVENSLTWVGSSVEEPVDTSFIEGNGPGIVRYELFISPSVADSVLPDTFLFALLAEPVSEDSTRDIWVSFSQKFELYIDFPNTGLVQIESPPGEDHLLSLVSLIGSQSSEEEPRGWAVKYEGPTGELGDVLLVPKESGLATLFIHGDQPGYRFSQVYLGPRSFIGQSAYQSGTILSLSKDLITNQDTVTLLANSRDTLDNVLFLCSSDSVRLSVIGQVNPNASFTWNFNDERIEEERTFQLGPFPAGGTYNLTLTIDGNNTCLGADLEARVEDIGIPLIADIVSPLDGTVFCDSDVEISAVAPPTGSIVRWSGINNDSSVNFVPTTDSSVFVSVSELGPYDIQLELVNGGCVNRDTISLFFLDTFDLDVGEDVSICPGDTVMIGTGAQSGLEYQWLPNGFLGDDESSQTTAFPEATTVYLLTATDPDEDCVASDAIKIEVFPNPQIESVTLFHKDEEMVAECGSTILQEIQNGIPFELSFEASEEGLVVNWAIDPTTSEGVDFSANNQRGTGSLSHLVNLAPNRSEGVITYLASIQDDRCGGTDTCRYSLRVIQGEGPLIIPQAITPNGDGLNDVWALLNMDPTSQYAVKVFNKSGGLVYQADNYFSLNNWDGGRLPDGSYWYRIEEINSTNTEVFTGGLYLQRNPE